jgi:hypothetical protein
MNSRMDKYENETPEYKKRTDKNAKLYEENTMGDYDKFDVNSNVSILKNNARNIDVDQIKEMLDKKYRDNFPKRQSISLDDSSNSYSQNSEDIKEDTKEYDINSILAKAKENKNLDYNEDRLNRVHNNDVDLINQINSKYSETNKENENEEQLMELINTITELELKNKDLKPEEATSDDLLNLKGNTDTVVLPPADGDSDKANKALNEPQNESIDETNTFYTGKLSIKKEDYDDFKDIQDDIKSNSILIKILIFIFILAILSVVIYFLNKYLNLGLF